MDEELIGLLSTVVIVRGFAWEMHQVLKLAIHLGKLSGFLHSCSLVSQLLKPCSGAEEGISGSHDSKRVENWSLVLGALSF